MFKKLAKSSLFTLVMSLLLLGALSGVVSADYVYEPQEKTVEYSCDTNVGATINPSIKIQANVPQSVNAGDTFTVKNARATVTISASEALLLRYLIGWTAFNGEVSLFEVHGDNVVQTVNVANPPIPIPTTSVPLLGPITFTAGGVDVDFDAGVPGVINLTAGNIEAEFNRVGSSGLNITLHASCTPKSGQDLTLATIDIAEN